MMMKGNLITDDLTCSSFYFSGAVCNYHCCVLYLGGDWGVRVGGGGGGGGGG